jgi:chromosomal replication initiator protein
MAGDQLEFGDDARSIKLRRAWEETLRILSAQVNKVTFESYIRPIKPLAYEDQLVTLGVASAFAREWLKRYTGQIQSNLEEQLGSPLEIKLALITAEHKPLFGETKEQPEPPKEEKPAGRAHSSAPPMEDIPSLPINEKYTFDNYVIGKSNRLAHAGALAVSGAPGKIYNPLFIYGSSGLGKTHLLHAIGNAAKKKSGKPRVAMVDGETFTQHYVGALRTRTVEEFRKRFRSVDIWLVDDIQFIAGKEQTKEEFFHTFNALYQTGKQIVISSDRSPRELRTMDERLRSRFESGLIADINAPEPEIREAILQQRCEVEGWDVPREVIEYIAGAIQSNVRALEGALNRLVAYSSVMGCAQSIELAQDILGEYFIEKPHGAGHRKGVPLEAIQIATADQFGFTQELLKSQRRDKMLALARQVAMYLCRDLTETPLAQIGAVFGGRDHTTVQRAVGKIESLLPHDRIVQRHVQEIRQKLDR